MPGPVQFDPRGGGLPVGPVGPAGAGAARRGASAGQEVQGGGSFKDVLLESLEQVNRLQQEASQGVERLATGQTENVAEVFSAVRKADVAFSLLMEIRNKLVEAYQEIRQMQV